MCDNNKDYYIANFYDEVNGEMRYNLYNTDSYTKLDAKQIAFDKFKEILDGVRYNVKYIREKMSLPVSNQFELVEEMAYKGNLSHEVQVVSILRKKNDNYYVIIYPTNDNGENILYEPINENGLIWEEARKLAISKFYDVARYFMSATYEKLKQPFYIPIKMNNDFKYTTAETFIYRKGDDFIVVKVCQKVD